MRERNPRRWHDILPDVSLAVSAVSLLLAILAFAVRLKTG